MVHSLLEPQLPAEAVFRPYALKPGPWVSLCPLALCPTPKCQGLSGQAHPGQRVSWGPQQLYMKFIHSTISLIYSVLSLNRFHILISEVRGHITNDLYI